MKQRWPAPERNRDPILEVLRRVLPARGLVLEVASGTGQHAEWFARHLPDLTWQPTDLDPESLESIDAWCADLDNVRPALRLDAEGDWPIDTADAVFSANMVHISPWEATLGLLAGAGRVLPPGGPLVLYGPYRRDGRHTADSNARFDESLRARDPRWGVRDLERVLDEAARCGLVLDEVVEMPANNLTVVARRPR